VALQNLAWIAFNRGDSVEAERRLDASAKHFGEIGDRGGVAWTLGLLGWVRFTQNKLEEASEVDRALREADAAREVFLELGDAWSELQSVTSMILALNAQGRRSAAEAMLDVADAIAVRLADSGMRNIPRILRVMIHAQKGDPEALPLIEAVNAELGKNAAVVTDERRVTDGPSPSSAGRRLRSPRPPRTRSRARTEPWFEGERGRCARACCCRPSRRGNRSLRRAKGHDGHALDRYRLEFRLVGWERVCRLMAGVPG